MTRGIKKTHDVFIEELKMVTNSILVLGRYEKNINPIHCKCLKCGYEWDPTPKSLLKGCGCPQCAGMKKLTHKEFLDKLSEVNPNFELIEVVSMYEGMGKKVICKCKVCGTVWTPKANDLIRKKTGCPSCSGNVFFTHDRFVKELNLKNPCASKILLLSSYNGMQQHIKCKCKDCGHEWNPVASSLIHGTGCPACAKTRVAEQAREVLMRIDRPKPHSHNWFVSKFTKKKHSCPNN